MTFTVESAQFTLRMCVPLIGCLPEPICRCPEILENPFAFQINDSKTSLRESYILIGSRAQIFYGFFHVLRYCLSQPVNGAEIKLAVRVSIFGKVLMNRKKSFNMF